MYSFIFAFMASDMSSSFMGSPRLKRVIFAFGSAGISTPEISSRMMFFSLRGIVFLHIASFATNAEARVFARLVSLHYILIVRFHGNNPAFAVGIDVKRLHDIVGQRERMNELPDVITLVHYFCISGIEH